MSGFIANVACVTSKGHVDICALVMADMLLISPCNMEGTSGNTFIYDAIYLFMVLIHIKFMNLFFENFMPLCSYSGVILLQSYFT